MSMASAKPATTARYSGSPTAPGSLVRSSTAIDRTVGGSAATSAGGNVWTTGRAACRALAAATRATVRLDRPAASPQHDDAIASGAW